MTSKIRISVILCAVLAFVQGMTDEAKVEDIRPDDVQVTVGDPIEEGLPSGREYSNPHVQKQNFRSHPFKKIIRQEIRDGIFGKHKGIIGLDVVPQFGDIRRQYEHFPMFRKNIFPSGIPYVGGRHGFSGSPGIFLPFQGGYGGPRQYQPNGAQYGVFGPFGGHARSAFPGKFHGTGFGYTGTFAFPKGLAEPFIGKKETSFFSREVDADQERGVQSRELSVNDSEDQVPKTEGSTNGEVPSQTLEQQIDKLSKLTPDHVDIENETMKKVIDNSSVKKQTLPEDIVNQQLENYELTTKEMGKDASEASVMDTSVEPLKESVIEGQRPASTETATSSINKESHTAEPTTGTVAQPGEHITYPSVEGITDQVGNE